MHLHGRFNTNFVAHTHICSNFIKLSAKTDFNSIQLMNSIPTKSIQFQDFQYCSRLNQSKEAICTVHAIDEMATFNCKPIILSPWFSMWTLLVVFHWMRLYCDRKRIYGYHHSRWTKSMNYKFKCGKFSALQFVENRFSECAISPATKKVDRKGKKTYTHTNVLFENKRKVEYRRECLSVFAQERHDKRRW